MFLCFRILYNLIYGFYLQFRALKTTHISISFLPVQTPQLSLEYREQRLSPISDLLKSGHLRCNQQIAASALLVKMPDVTRSTVQKAVVVLASKPVFGPIRDKLGVVTTALFQQRLATRPRPITISQHLLCAEISQKSRFLTTLNLDWNYHYELK